MGNAVAADGTMAMQCQNCHGAMSAVGAPTRTGWLEEPTCQNCHTGTATHEQRRDPLHLGVRRHRPAARGRRRDVRDQRRHARAGALALPLLGGPRRPAVRGVPRLDARRVPLVAPERQPAERRAPGARRDDRRVRRVPHGRRADATRRPARHAPGRRRRGYRGHGDGAEREPGAVPGLPRRRLPRHRAVAHVRGPDARRPSFGTKTLFRGAQVGCYTCHNGPSSESANPNRTAGGVRTSSASTSAGAPVAVTLVATDPDGNALTLRIVSQPGHGTVGLSGTTATYFPYAGFTGTDTFTYAAWDGSIDSNLATVTVTVAEAPSVIASVTIAKPKLTGCLKTVGTVTLSVAAPAAGTVVTLTSDNLHVSVPPSVTVKSGVLSTRFNVLTSAVASAQPATIRQVRAPRCQPR